MTGPNAIATIPLRGADKPIVSPQAVPEQATPAKGPVVPAAVPVISPPASAQQIGRSDKVEALFQRAETLYSRHEYALARRFFDQVIALTQAGAGSSFIQADSYLYVGRYDEAYIIFEQIIDNSEDPNEINAAHLNLANHYLELLNFEAALEQARLIPDDYEACHIQSSSLLGLGQWREAEAIRQAALMKIAAVKRTDKKAYSENGRLQLWEAEFLLDSCQAEQAIKIGWRLANNSRLKDQALDLLTQVYQRSGDYAGLRKVAHAYRNAGYAYEYYRLQVMLIIYEISTLDPRRDQIKIGKLEEKMRFYGTQFIESVELQRAENFTTAANYLQQIEQILFTSGFVQPELFQSLLGSIPPGAERLRLYADKLVAFQVMHQAGASGRALEFHGYQLQYLPLNEFNPPLLPTYHEGSDFEEIMLTPDRREAPYYVADSDRLHEILETGYTTLAAEAGVEVPEVRDLSDLSMPEALRFLARISEDIVWQYAEDPAADFACLPLEERISRDYFNQAVCRHYTIIFLALFNELKKHNAHLQGYHAISDFSPLHTFPTVFTVQGRQVYFTSLDPTADDATPAFGDKLAVSLTEHFQLNEFAAAEVKAKRYDAALALIRGNLAQIQDNPYEVIISYRSILEVHTLKGSEVPAYQQLEAEIEQYQAAHPLQEETAPAFCYLRLILAKVKDKLGKSDQAQALLKKLLGDPTFPAPVRTELESAYIAIIAKREDGGGAELEKIIRSRGSLAVYGKVAARGSAEAQIEHPLFSRLVPGTRVVIRLNGDRFYARVYKGQVQLPGELKPYKNELTGYELEIVISRPRRLKTFHPADTE